jgi:carboxylate-amine ligase
VTGDVVGMTSGAKARSDSSGGDDAVSIGVEEEFHVVDLKTRELVAGGPGLLERLPDESFGAELHGSVVEGNSAVHTQLDDLRADLLSSRSRLASVAGERGLGVVAAGTVPLVDPLRMAVTPSSRFERMLEEYQLLVREQLICGAQVHVQLSDRDVAVAVGQRLAPYLPILLALSASSPFWMGEDSGYASARSLIWQRWPTSGHAGEIGSAAEHDALVADLVTSGTISDERMVYFDVRPSSHLPTVELRVPDACPDVDTVILITALFRALVHREREAAVAGRPASTRPAPLLRAAMWRAARSGLEGDLLDLPTSPRPVPAAAAVRELARGLRAHLEAQGDWEQVSELVERSLARGSSADQQRRAYKQRGRLSDVVDMLLERTPGGSATSAGASGVSAPSLSESYVAAGDEVFGAVEMRTEYRDILDVLEREGTAALRQRELLRDEELRSHGVTFGVAGQASTRLMDVDLIPRVVPAADWSELERGLSQRARALDAFLHDVYDERAIVADGIVPQWVIDGSPGLRPVGALMRRQQVRAHVCGMDVVCNADGGWSVLEDNLRVPSGLGYAVQSRRLTAAVMADVPHPSGVIDVEAALPMLRETLTSAALPAAGDNPAATLLSEGPEGPAWFEHRMLGAAMGLPVATTTDLVVQDDRLFQVGPGGRRQVDVLYLRIAEDELMHASGADGRPLGPPLVSALHAGRLACANALGNGVGDDKTVYSFVPDMVRYYLGEQPLLNSVPTFLCGVPEQREHVLDRLETLVVKPVDGYGGEGILIGPQAPPEELEATRRQIVAAPHRWIAQEMVSLSTVPCFDGERLVPRYADLRAFVFVAADARVAPAALTRVAPSGSMVVNSSRGGGAKDTWLLR